MNHRIKINEQQKKLLSFFFGIPLTVLSLTFIARVIFTNRNDVVKDLATVNLFGLLSGTIFLLLFFLLRSFVWSRLLNAFGYKIDPDKSTFLITHSEITRYVPGSILAFVSRAHNFAQVDVPARITMKLIFFEAVIFVFSSAVVSIPGLLYLANVAFGDKSVYLILILVLIPLLLVLPKIIAVKKEIKQTSIIAIFSWIFFGLGNFLIAASLHFLDPGKIIALASVFVLSWLVGYLVFFVPSGLGAREALITLGLSPILPIGTAATVAIVQRIIFVFSEILFLTLAFINARFLKILRRIDLTESILWGSIASYILYFTYVSFEKHLNFFTGKFDLGNMDQTVWNTLNGRIFELTNPNGVNQISRLAIHSDFVLILLSPLYLIWSDPRTLLFVQTVILGLGAYFVYLISKRILKNNLLSLAFSVSYLLNPFLQKQNLFDFHAVTLATTFILAAFYFLLIKRQTLGLTFLILSALTKENVFLISAIFGIYLFIKERKLKWLILAFSSVLIFFLLVSMLIPQARGTEHFATEYFQDFGTSPMEITANILLNPLKTIELLTSSQNILYAYRVFLPVGFLSFLAPFFLIFSAPDFLINLLSKNENLRSVNFHYGATIIPFVYISAIFGTRFLIRFSYRSISEVSIAIFILLSSLYSTYLYGTLPGSRNPSTEIYTNYLKEKDKIREFLARIPKDLSVVSSNNLGAHLSQRERIFVLPNGVDEADVIVFLLNDPFAQPSLDAQRNLANHLVNDPNYIELARIGDFLAFAKRSSAKYVMPAIK